MNLFVYGTLRNTYDNPMAQLLRKNADFVGHGYVPGRLLDLGWYPGATYEPDSPYRVWGDVFALTDETILKQLDDYEGIDNHPDDEYARQEVLVQLVSDASGEPISPREVRCQMYVFMRADGQQTRIKSGNFLTR
ncbi:gamma-glutamylcyclotransferase [uncultured Fibrella sp.]|uniref:gamma-glutamylcyclotransferase family protein n=1 Tax=uncultured Fibrella sp. TaxID=1284596 RepID=UPI0035CA41BA